MTFTRTALLAGAFLASSGGAAAQPGPGGMMGAETRADVAARADQLFARLDADGDGRVTGDELRGATGGMGGPDAPPPPPDMGPGGPNAMFDRLDSDHNGSISRQEFARMGPGGPAGPAGPRMGMGRGGGGAMLARMVGPNGLTRDDLRARMLQRFDRLDADHDGRISPAEREQARARVQQMRGAGPMGRPDPEGEQ